MLYTFLLSLHNLNRWLVLLCGFWIVWQLTVGWIRHYPWQPRYTTLVRIFAWVVSLQFVLGLALFLLPNAFIQSVIANIPWTQIMKDRLLRFFTLEHPVQMFIAIGLAHMALTTARRVKNERRRFAWTSSLMIVAMILILTAIPWPGSFNARPWIRLPFAAQEHKLSHYVPQKGTDEIDSNRRVTGLVYHSMPCGVYTFHGVNLMLCAVS